MSDLISRSALVKCMSERWRTLVALNGEYDHYTAGFDDAISYVDDAPAVDAVEVVRCRECKEWKHGLCKLLFADTPDDGYCSFGENMDGGAEG